MCYIPIDSTLSEAAFRSVHAGMKTVCTVLTFFQFKYTYGLPVGSLIGEFTANSE